LGLVLPVGEAWIDDLFFVLETLNNLLRIKELECHCFGDRELLERLCRRLLSNLRMTELDRKEDKPSFAKFVPCIVLDERFEEVLNRKQFARERVGKQAVLLVNVKSVLGVFVERLVGWKRELYIDLTFLLGRTTWELLGHNITVINSHGRREDHCCARRNSAVQFNLHFVDLFAAACIVNLKQDVCFFPKVKVVLWKDDL